MFDRDAFEALTGADPEVARELTDLFRRDIGELLDSLVSATQEGRDEDVRRVGHTMKSSCASMGATEASAMGARVEAEGLQTASELLDALRKSVTSALDAMEACCSGIGA